jgi:hypothetical protein
VRAAGVHEAGRLVADEPHRVEAYRLETDLINSLNRIYYFTKRTAREVLPLRKKQLQDRAELAEQQ